MMDIGERSMQEQSGRRIKEQAHRLVDELADDATWEDLMYSIYVRQAIEDGVRDSEAGRIMPVRDVKSKLGLSQ
jgi:hypothetical protein